MTAHNYIQYSLILKLCDKLYITAVEKENSDMELTVLWAMRRNSELVTKNMYYTQILIS